MGVLLSMLTLLPMPFEVSSARYLVMATHFDVPERDPSNKHAWAACLKRDLRPETDLIIASRTLPCKAHVTVYCPRTGRSVEALVGERGPFGANWRGVDLAPAVAKALRTNGYEPVMVLVKR